jgi:choline dehydrogenase-like flavoprotein
VTEPYDIVVIGTGIGGATLVNRLADSGARLLVLERGRHLEPSPQARDSKAIFLEGRFRPEESWRDSAGRPFNPGNYYCVGGNSKFYGAVMLRYREQDFAAQEFDDGLSPAWPFAYDELAPYYDQAERLYGVRGAAGEDPSEPARAGPYPHPPVADEPSIAELRAKLTALGLKPFSLPLALDLDRWLAHGQTPWDAFPDTCGGKRDAETAALAPVLERSNICLRTGVELRRLIAAPDGKRIESAEVAEAGVLRRIAAPLFVLSAGAVNSAAVLLRSADGKNPRGLANGSDGVGRRFMNHNCAALVSAAPSSLEELPARATEEPSETELAGWFDAARSDVIEALAGAGTDTAMWTWSEARDSGFFHRRMAHESTLHRLDADLAVDGSLGDVTAAFASDGIDEFVHVGMRHSLRRPERTYPDGSLHLHCTDTEGEWMVVPDGSGGLTVTREHAKGDVAVRGPAVSILRYIWGRERENVDVFGDEGLADAWARCSP